MNIKDNLQAIEARIRSACEKAGRSRSEVKLVAVSKTQPAEAVIEAAEAGQILFGENRVQEALPKISRCPQYLHWHLIGHLQRNKARIAASGLFRMIHSVDSEKLLCALDEYTATPLPILIQVNVSGEGSKFGCAPDETAALVNAANQCSQVEVHGLMTIPPFTADPEKARIHFSNLRKLRDRLQEETDTPLPELSMGMSRDFEIAIEEGATYIRVGSDIFGGRS
ncbi:MAG: dependent protein [Verrucomicrobiota bacterium]|jgi:pyridoxal phosphate enzyme (YggS family)|nr:dependent protein [Verrucomicrobiota bacterium]MDK2962753.1 dependent protein [Verrucomicrobiota bacterium]